MAYLDRVVFLDIDGVLQPGNAQDRFQHDMEGLKNQLTREVDPGYDTLARYDIAAVYYDWEPSAVENLRTLCESLGASIVISSAWRESKTLEQLRLLFRIHRLDSFVAACTAELGRRDCEIDHFLAQHPEVQRFVILDDGYWNYFRRRFPDEFTYCSHIFDGACLEEAMAILGRPFPTAPPEPVVLFEALADPAADISRVVLSLAQITVIRRWLRLTPEEFLRRLTQRVVAHGGLTQLSLDGFTHDFLTGRYVGTIDPFAIAQLLDMLRGSPKLTRLSLADNNFTDIRPVLELLEAGGIALAELDVSHNALNEECLLVFCDYIRRQARPIAINLARSAAKFSSQIIAATTANPQVTVSLARWDVQGCFRRAPPPPNLILCDNDRFPYPAS